jgi:glycosidase
MFEFHISRASRERYGVDGVLFSYDGNAVFADPAASRALAHRINEARGAGADPKKQVQPAALFAMGLIDEAAHALFDYYRRTVAPKVIQEALAHFGEQVGHDAVDSLLLRFVTEFPGTEVYAGKVTPHEWLEGETEGFPHREAAFEELMLLWFENRNPSFAPFRELFDDTRLREGTAYPEVTAGLPAFFASQPEMGGGRGGMFELLLTVLGSGSALSDQLALLRGKWGFAVEALLRKLLLAGDVLKEEEVAIWLQFNPPDAETLARRNRFDGWGNTRGEVPDYATAPAEYEHFSPDQEWMPRTVMIAKSTYVWLNQLSRFYGREILRLDQIPDEELQTLASRGMNALWLIGVWERSRASQTIKRLCGNGDAVASAYSLYDYRIADNLGGDWAYQNLRDRCSRCGIRLASDMVPNHMGIDSPWVIEHPEWFLSRQDSPYPAYSFNGPNLSDNDRVEIKIEDHYYNQSDASVVFMRRDKWSGDTQFVYHGNDGTSFPWNDTAQLNYMSAAVREQVIQTILHVARLFPIIRFDAAMTLAKRHIQRLWFPAPGAGGAIPSRAESAISTEEFDRLIPEEFWREVVDRVAREVPGTLLLAEAFWMMEGYFVRTLGMHRVYNSAFMVMLRDEDNANYRTLLKKTLEFDPGILKRYVNFMSNPDERTAIDQFGDGDKYFGVATMMSTLPGLPMFGHGQIEGFTEKYGMEYYRPRHEEWPQQWMVDRHNREIAPLLYQRALFAESENFLLYDLWHDGGGVNENVFAYSNYYEGRRALIAYNNSYGGAHGTLHGSVAYMDKGAGELRQRSIADGLQLPHDYDLIIAWRNNRTGQFHLRRSQEFHQDGVRVDLGGYGYLVMLDWQELRNDATHDWGRLCDVLSGRGVEDLENAILALELEHVHHALREALTPRLVREFATQAHRTAEIVREDVAMVPHSELLEQWIVASARFVELTRAEYFKRVQPPPAKERKLKQEAEAGFEEAASQNEESLTETRLRERVAAMLRLPLVEAQFAEAWPVEARKVLPSVSPHRNSGSVWAPVLAYSLLAALGESLDLGEPARPALSIYDAFGLRGVLALAFGGVEFSGEDTWRAAARVRIALASGVYASDFEPHSLQADPPQEHGLPRAAWEDGDVRWLLGVNEHKGVHYCNSESLEQMIWWRLLPRLLAAAVESPVDAAAVQAVAAGVRTAKAEGKAAGFTVPGDRQADASPAAADAEQSGGSAETSFTADDPASAMEEEPEPEAAAVAGRADEHGKRKKAGGGKSKKK